MSPRPRQTNRDLPACMYEKHGAYWLVKGGKWRRLAKDKRAALIAYAKLTQPTQGGMPKLIDEALTYILPQVKPSTAKQYRLAGDRLKIIFADFEPAQVQMADVTDMMRMYVGRPNMGNRLLSVLQQVFDYARQDRRIEHDPCLRVERHEEKKRTRLIQWKEYHAIWDKATPRLRCVMDLMVTTGQRPVDILKIRRSDLNDDGIYFKQAKTGAQVLVPWNKDMKAASDRAKALQGNSALTLFRTRSGGTPAYKTVYDEWCRACKAAGIEDADLRDLRALAGTEAKRQGKNPTKLLGHKSTRMTERYLRDREIEVAEGPVIRRGDVKT